MNSTLCWRHSFGEKSGATSTFDSQWHHCITFTQNQDQQESVCICSCWRSDLNSAFPWWLHSHEVMSESLFCSSPHFSHCKTWFALLIPTGFVAVNGECKSLLLFLWLGNQAHHLCCALCWSHVGRTEPWRNWRVQLLGGGFTVVPKYLLAVLAGPGCVCKHSQALSFELFFGARFSFDVKQDVCVLINLFYSG